MAEEEPKRQPYQSPSELAFSRIGGTVPSALPGDHLGSAGQIIRGVVGGDQAAAIQRNISATMAGLISDMRRAGDGGNPKVGGERPATVTPGGAAPARSGPVQRGTGWAKEVPIQTPGGATTQAYIEALVHAAQPMGSGNSAFRGPKPKDGG
jgi:hypothetical protein